MIAASDAPRVTDEFSFDFGRPAITAAHRHTAAMVDIIKIVFFILLDDDGSEGWVKVVKTVD